VHAYAKPLVHNSGFKPYWGLPLVGNLTEQVTLSILSLLIIFSVFVGGLLLC